MGANFKGTREISVIGGLGVSHNHDSVLRWVFLRRSSGAEGPFPFVR